MALHWTDAESAALLELAGDLPLDLLARVWASEASKHGWPLRDRAAIKRRLNRMGTSVVPTGKWLTIGALAGLGFTRTTVTNWLRKGIVPALRSHGGHPFYFQRADVVRLARQQPWRFGGCDVDELFLVLGDRKLAERIAEQYPFRHACARRVKCLETGRVFPTANEAAATAYCTVRAIRTGIREGRPVVGFRWEWVV